LILYPQLVILGCNEKKGKCNCRHTKSFQKVRNNS